MYIYIYVYIYIMCRNDHVVSLLTIVTEFSLALVIIHIKYHSYD